MRNTTRAHAHPRESMGPEFAALGGRCGRRVGERTRSLHRFRTWHPELPNKTFRTYFIRLYFIQLYFSPNFTPTSLLRHPYFTPISALLQLYFRYKLRFRTAHNSQHRCNRQQCVTSIPLQPYFSSTSVPLQLYFSSTSALLQLYCSYTSALLQFYFSSTSAVLQLYFSLQPDQTQAGTYKLRFRMVFQAMMLLMMM
jgi:hypothetical protein